ncbi:BON1-associated protein 2-like [Andrographis paniculata]|uniref:BON1-associated protein 2-like n=1 Tax=Andrographis paniculata TaxID=175694 RepID=UPI0021E77F8C|nr:BON1-associated protein 2-like [Andrographis paniculata]
MERAINSKLSIEVTVISAEGLLVNRKPPGKKKNLFVAVRSDPYDCRLTAADKDGGSNPRWNQKLEMDLPINVRYITVAAYSGRNLIGTATVPAADFSGGHLPENHLSFLSYRLRDDNGEKNGIINLSVKVKGHVGKSCAAAVGCSEQPWKGVPVDGKGSGTHGIVTGIPVSYRYSS